MKKIEKKFLITILISTILLFATHISYAENTTNDANINSTTNTVTNTVTNTATNVTTNTTTNTVVDNTSSNSGNTVLNSLGIRPYDFTGFKNAKTSYDVTVPENVESVEVYATTQDKNAKLEGTGIKKLEKGKNVAQVTVTAQNGTKKTFTINIIRGEENSQVEENEDIEENIEDNSETYEGLKNISIEGLTLTPEFQTNEYEYTLKYIGEGTELQLDVEPTNENYTVEIIGNNNLVEGENTITILVSEKDGTNVATYQITVNKSLVDEEAIAKQKEMEEKEKKEKEQKTIVIIVCSVGVAILVIAIILVIRSRKNKNYEDEDDYDEFSSYGDDYEDDVEDIPRALKNRNKSTEEMTKEQAKEKFLNNYSNYEEEYYNEKTKRNNSKGKRFKD